jgi:hypothetical protein
LTSFRGTLDASQSAPQMPSPKFISNQKHSHPM